eukprot:scaffold26577_cov70-Skeletonema_dohrnii-CCMP3373.AAC.2
MSEFCAATYRSRRRQRALVASATRACVREGEEDVHLMSSFDGSHPDITTLELKVHEASKLFCI